jgi:uncharacterized membrane protein
MVFTPVPLKNSFMVASIIGFFVSIVYISNYSKTWAFTFALVFVLMFIASMISMTYSPTDYTRKRK